MSVTPEAKASYNSYMKSYMRTYNANRTDTQVEHEKESKRQYYVKNGEAMRAQHKIYAAANKEQLKASRAIYYAVNRDKILAAGKAKRAAKKQAAVDKALADSLQTPLSDPEPLSTQPAQSQSVSPQSPSA